MPSSCKIAFTAKQVERIRDMKAEGWRQYQIARIMGVSEGTISAYLRGLRKGKK